MLLPRMKHLQAVMEATDVVSVPHGWANANVNLLIEGL